MVWGLRIALTAFLLANAVVLVSAASNRLGEATGRLIVEECRLERADAPPGLLARLSGEKALVKLRAAPFYLPTGEVRPLAARLAAFGFGAAAERPAVRGFVAVEADGPAAEGYAEKHGGGPRMPLAVRDAAPAADALEKRYAAEPGIGIADGIVAPAADGLAPRLAVHALHLSRKQREYLAELPLQGGEACRSRFLAEIVYGERHDPYVAAIRPLDLVRP